MSKKNKNTAPKKSKVVATEGMKTILGLNEPATPCTHIRASAIPGTPPSRVDFFGMDKYQTVLMEFAKTLLSEFDVKIPAERINLMDKAHDLTESYFERVRKTGMILNDLREENRANAPKVEQPANVGTPASKLMEGFKADQLQEVEKTIKDGQASLKETIGKMEALGSETPVAELTDEKKDELNKLEDDKIAAEESPKLEALK